MEGRSTSRRSLLKNRLDTRKAALILSAVGAFLVGGVGQAVVWRWDIDWLTAVSGSQFLWVLLCFFVAWAWSLGRLLPGAAAGAITGLMLIVSYYVVQWLLDGRHAAVAQFTESRGLAWTGASVVGGAAVGLLGALAAASASTTPRRKAFGLVSAALIMGLGPAAWLTLTAERAQRDGASIAAAIFVCVAVGLLWVALRRCGLAHTIRGGIPAVAVTVALLVTLLVLQRSVLYMTF
jgi:hypothetical protein